jgi:hypothetical protein
MGLSTKAQIKVADEVWIAAALLQRENPGQADFSLDEIVERAQRESLHGSLRPGVYVHAVQHCVANRPPNPGRYRMLFETSAGRRRLFRKGDSYHPDREGAKVTPEAQDMPEGFAHLLAWYAEWCEEARCQDLKNDPLLQAVGSGKALWADEHADEYVRRLREGWE